MKTAMLMLVSAMFLYPMVAVTQTKKVTPQGIQKEIARGKQYVLVLLKRGANASAIDSVTLERNQMEHLVHLFTMKSQGVLPIFGPVFEDTDLRGICIFNTDDKNTVKAMLDEDPHIKSGRLAYELYSWFGLPGDRLPK